MKDVGYLLANPKSRKTGVCFVGIDGHGGSGKSTLAEFLSKRLNAETIHSRQIGKTELQALWESWLLEEDGYFARDTPKAYADFVVDGTIAFESQLSFAKCL